MSCIDEAQCTDQAPDLPQQKREAELRELRAQRGKLNSQIGKRKKSGEDAEELVIIRIFYQIR